jgi:hypothetical protein
VIQGSLRKELPKDVTVLTVAHRLRTIMDSDRIVRPGGSQAKEGFTHGLHFTQMVLDAGRLVGGISRRAVWESLTVDQVEFDSPAALLTMEHGYLRALVDESPDKDELRVMAAKRIV